MTMFKEFQRKFFMMVILVYAMTLEMSVRRYLEF